MIHRHSWLNFWAWETCLVDHIRWARHCCLSFIAKKKEKMQLNTSFFCLLCHKLYTEATVDVCSTCTTWSTWICPITTCGSWKLLTPVWATSRPSTWLGTSWTSWRASPSCTLWSTWTSATTSWHRYVQVVKTHAEQIQIYCCGKWADATCTVFARKKRETYIQIHQIKKTLKLLGQIQIFHI